MTTRVPVQDCIFRSMAEMIAQYFHYGNNLPCCIVPLSLLVCNLELRLQLLRRVQPSDHLHTHFDYIRCHSGCHLLGVLGKSDQVFLSLWIVHAMKCSWSHEWPIHWLTYCVFWCLLREPTGLFWWSQITLICQKLFRQFDHFQCICLTLFKFLYVFFFYYNPLAVN